MRISLIIKYLTIGLFSVIASIPSFATTLHVTTTTSLIADLTSQIAGPHAQITPLMGPGVDPHLYKASASDIQKLQRADIILYNGLHLEGRMADLFHNLSKRGKPTFAVTDSIPKDQLLPLDSESTQFDPHVWFNPLLWALTTHTIADALAQADPPNAHFYHAQAQTLRGSLHALHAWASVKVSELPSPKRILITSHDAYNYFGQAFNFQVVGVQGISTASEAGLADIVSMVDFIQSHQVKAIFVESSVSPAAIDRISKDSGASIGGQLFSDALGAPGQIINSFDVGTYEGMFKYNLTTIIEALK